MRRSLNTSKKRETMATPVRRPTIAVGSNPEPRFADERAKIAWEVGRQISCLLASFPTEKQNLEAKTIAFAPKHISRGTYAVFLSGTVIGTEREGVFVVPQRSLEILDRLRIPYMSVTSE
jgi:hypothetical protein